MVWREIVDTFWHVFDINDQRDGFIGTNGEQTENQKKNT